ncbi:hypothetical protein GCM10027262_53440 [Nocardia tengchongensis]
MSEKRTARIGLAAVALTAALIVEAGPATADTPSAAPVSSADTTTVPTGSALVDIPLYGVSLLISLIEWNLRPPSTDPCHGNCS